MMLRSLFSAVSALRNHQTALDVIGNNLANVNTTGFKYGRANFQDTLYQTMIGPQAPQSAAGQPQTGLGGINSTQVGLGMRLAGIDTIQTQGSFQNTGRTSDLAIQGNGYFILSDQTPVAGGGGATSARIVYTRDGAFDFDSLGRMVNPTNGMVVQGYAIPAGQNSAPPGGTLGPITIPPNTYTSFAISQAGVVTGFTANGTATAIAQIAIASFPNPSGLLKVGSNGLQWTPAAGGAPAGATPSASDIANAAAGLAASGGRGEFMVGTLEMSNVDIAGQMSQMIVTQRGFQANSRVVTTSDEMLQELMSLKR
jgi:flagellar hook protein FlgE